jgi:hypothetical protein
MAHTKNTSLPIVLALSSARTVTDLWMLAHNRAETLCWRYVFRLCLSILGRSTCHHLLVAPPYKYLGEPIGDKGS